MDFIVICIITVILGSAIAYIVNAKKNGVKCIGCSSSKKCTTCNCEDNHKD